MATNNDIIHPTKFNHLVGNYTGIDRDILREQEYEIESIPRRELTAIELALQTVRMTKPPKRKGKDIVLTATTFLILYPPAQEEKIDNNDYYARRAFPNFYFLLEKNKKSGKFEFQEMTTEGPRYGMTKILLPDFDSAAKLIDDIAKELFALTKRLGQAQGLIAQGQADVKQAQRDFYKSKQEHIERAALPEATNNR